MDAQLRVTDTIHLYGHEIGEGSFVQVTRGVRRALEHHGLLGGFTPETLAAEDEEPGRSRVALHVGWCWNSRRYHERRWALVAPNSNGIPARVVEHLRGRGVCGIAAPSRWALETLRETFGKEIMVLAPHGITPGIHGPVDDSGALRAVYPDEFRVLHVTSTDFSRKGTRELVTGWTMALGAGHLPSRSSLVIVGTDAVVYDPFIRKAERVGVRAVRPVGLPPADWASRLRGFHAVCQPSRAEGFGLVPLEALACGVPVVATVVTGHSEYMSATTPGVVVVPAGPDSRSDDFPGATAPTVSADGIATALAEAYRQWPRISAAARSASPAIVERWAWERVMQGALEEMSKA